MVKTYNQFALMVYPNHVQVILEKDNDPCFNMDRSLNIKSPALQQPKASSEVSTGKGLKGAFPPTPPSYPIPPVANESAISESIPPPPVVPNEHGAIVIPNERPEIKRTSRSIDGGVLEVVEVFGNPSTTSETHVVGHGYRISPTPRRSPPPPPAETDSSTPIIKIVGGSAIFQLIVLLRSKGHR